MSRSESAPRLCGGMHVVSWRFIWNERIFKLALVGRECVRKRPCISGHTSLRSLQSTLIDSNPLPSGRCLKSLFFFWLPTVFPGPLGRNRKALLIGASVAQMLKGSGQPEVTYGTAHIIATSVLAVTIGWIARDVMHSPIDVAQNLKSNAISSIPRVPCLDERNATSAASSHCSRWENNPSTPVSGGTQPRYLTRQEASERIYFPAGHTYDFYKQLDPQSLPPATYEMQAWLHAWQHPADCTKSKFLLFHDYPSGIGSQV